MLALERACARREEDALDIVTNEALLSVVLYLKKEVGEMYGSPS